MWSGLAIVVALLAVLGVSFTQLAVGALKSLCRMAALLLFAGLVGWALSGVPTRIGLWVLGIVGGAVLVWTIGFTLAWNRDFPDRKLGWDGKPLDRQRPD